MSLSNTSTNERLSAEALFKDAFERLKRGTPNRLRADAPVSQNNVAREAGCDPSALRKGRYPNLIGEIQAWVRTNSLTRGPSKHKVVVERRRKNQSLQTKILALKAQRDHAVSLLLEADAKILELTMENSRLASTIADLHGGV